VGAGGRRRGAAVFVNYSLLPEARHPTAIEENYAAVKWVAENGFAHGLAVVGDSVGGSVIAAVTIVAKERGSPTIHQSQCRTRSPRWPGTSPPPNGWYMVATEDRALRPDMERFLAQRIGATTVEVKSSHVPFISRPSAVFKLIEDAVKAVMAGS
jgi:hypothetical protein